MTENLDKVSLEEVLDIYNELGIMIKSLQDDENNIAESEKND